MLHVSMTVYLQITTSLYSPRDHSLLPVCRMIQPCIQDNAVSSLLILLYCQSTSHCQHLSTTLMVIITMYIIEKKYRVVVVHACVWLLFIINCSGLSSVLFTPVQWFHPTFPCTFTPVQLCIFLKVVINDYNQRSRGLHKYIIFMLIAKCLYNISIICYIVKNNPNMNATQIARTKVMTS